MAAATVEAKGVKRCTSCGGSMIATYDTDVKRKIWHCMGCSLDEDPMDSPAASSASQTAVATVSRGIGVYPGSSPNAISGGDWISSAGSRLRALLTQVAAHEELVRQMKAEAERTAQALQIMGLTSVPDMPWKTKKRAKSSAQSTPQELGSCATCGQPFLNRWCFMFYDGQRICKKRQCRPGEATTSLEAAV